MTSEIVKDIAKVEENEEKLEKVKEENNEENNEENKDNNIDFKVLFFSHPSQKDKKKKDFTEYSRVDMKLLNKKREREVKKEGNLEENNNKLAEDKNINNKEEKDEKKEETKKEEKIEDKEEKKENELENNLPNELIELINQVKNSEPLTVEDFEKYKAYKKLNLNVYKK